MTLCTKPECQTTAGCKCPPYDPETYLPGPPAPDYKALARRLSDALLKVRPLGGSELFTKVGDEYFADPDFCGQAIEEMHQQLFDARVTLHESRRMTVRCTGR